MFYWVTRELQTRARHVKAMKMLDMLW